MSRGSPSIVWFRQDLRLADNPALHAAVERGAPILPVYVLDDETPGRWRMGGASRWWLHRSLEALALDLGRAGASLILRRGKAEAEIGRLVEETGAGAVIWSRCYEPYNVERDRRIDAQLQARGVEVHSFNGALLMEPRTVLTAAGQPFKVFTAFWKALRASYTGRDLLPRPPTVTDTCESIRSDELDSWKLLPGRPDWAKGFGDWRPGEEGARDRLGEFLGHGLIGYRTRRNRPDLPSTSRLSPHLHFGEISPAQVWVAITDMVTADERTASDDAESFLSELGWREFSYNLLHHFPNLPDEPWRSEFRRFPWVGCDEAERAWRRGRTGLPIVDAGMRELWATGWMHNRVRMIAASFLVKDLLTPWQDGEAWFWDTLVDADLANNAASWQWVTGSGADAAPYFRIFNPVLQGETFDPDGAYVRRWVPEIARLPDPWIHKPWLAPDMVLNAAGVVLGKTYPRPIVDHGEARQRALQAFNGLRRGTA